MNFIDSLLRRVGLRQDAMGSSGFARTSLPSLDPWEEPLYKNSAFFSAIHWTMNNWGQANLETFKRIPGPDQDEIMENSDAAAAWRYGHPRYGRSHVESGMILSLLCPGGTSFLWPLRNGMGKIVGFQWLPHYECQFDTDDMVLYSPPNGKIYRIPESELIINRYGVNPDNLKKGYSPIESCVDEVMTDQEAAQFSRAVIRNFGVVSGIISPPSAKDGDTVPAGMSTFEVRDLRRMISDSVSGENRGKLIVSPKPLRYEQITATPEKMALEKVRRIPEERISAVFNIPAVVLGLGAGLDKSTYNNVKEAKKSAWTNYLIPLQDQIAKQWDRQLLPQLENEENLYLGWDRKHIEALREDEDARVERFTKLFMSDIITRNEARRSMDMKDAAEDGFFSALRAGNAQAEAKAKLMARINDRDHFDG